MAIGGTMPPTMTAAMIMYPLSAWDASAAVPNTYAALLNGPPMSMDIMPATTRPRTMGVRSAQRIQAVGQQLIQPGEERVDSPA